MAENVKISIIIPVYNAENYIEACMRCVYAQTLQDYEIILVNDGSTDNSAEICKRYASEDSRVTYIEKENGGAGSARNAGIEAATGKYLAFPDVDDTFEQNMYEELYALAESGNYDMVISGANYFRQEDGKLVFNRTENVKPLAYTSRDACRRHVMDFFPTTTVFDVPWNKLYKRSVIVENRLRFTDLRRCQDATFNLDFYNCVQSVASVDKAYYNYRENTVADVQRKFPKNLIDINIYYYTHLTELMTSWGIYTGDVKRHYDSTFIIAIYSAMDRFDNPRWRLSRSAQKAYLEDILNRPEIESFLPEASVGDDVREMYNIILHKDIKQFLRLHKKERFKESVRSNPLLIGLYRKLKGN